MRKLAKTCLMAATLSTASLAASSTADATSTGNFGFLYSGGTFTEIDVPGAIDTGANGINDSGQIVGNFVDSSGNSQGFLDTGGSLTYIEVPGATFTSADGINDAGQIVGFSGGPSVRGFLYSGGSFNPIDVPGTTFTEPLGINESGQIVGVFYNGTGYSGFLYSGGTLPNSMCPARPTPL